MKPYLLFFAVLTLSLASCSSSKHVSSTAKNVDPTNSGLDGSSEEKAIMVNETSETAGVAAEYDWLKEHYPGYTLQEQRLIIDSKKNGHPYDLMNIKTAEGKKMGIYFDIIKYFGKF